MFSKILIPVDLAEPEYAKPAVDAGAAMARQSGGSLRLITVMPEMPPMLADYVPGDFDAQQKAATEEALAIIARECGLEPGQTSVVVRQGGVHHEVLDEAKSFEADLIVMSSHQPGVRTYLLGSTAAHVVRHATCSVLVVRQPE